MQLNHLSHFPSFTVSVTVFVVIQYRTGSVEQLVDPCCCLSQVPDLVVHEEVYDDDDDENDESNWRNDYPDEESDLESDREERYGGMYWSVVFCDSQNIFLTSYQSNDI